MKKWEISLLVGLLVGLLSAPASARETVLSRWTVEDSGAEQYQISLFPFAVGRVEEDCITEEAETEPVVYELDFQLMRWWREWSARREARVGNG